MAKTQLVEFKCDYCAEKVTVNMEKSISDNPLRGWIQIIRERQDTSGQNPPVIEHYCKTSCAINGLKMSSAFLITPPAEKPIVTATDQA